jgi:hypothetical protein
VGDAFPHFSDRSALCVVLVRGRHWSTPLVAFDLGGILVFALNGAAAGVKDRLDLFGVVV